MEDDIYKQKLASAHLWKDSYQDSPQLASQTEEWREKFQIWR